MDRLTELKSLKKSVFRTALIATILITGGLVVAMIPKFSMTPGVIGWGITLGTPLLLGFYAGIFAWVGYVDPKDPRSGKVPVRFKSLFRWIGIAFVALFFMLLGYFFLDASLRGTKIADNFFNMMLSGLYCSAMGLLVFFLPMTLATLLTLFLGKGVRRYILNRHLRKMLVPMLLLPLFLPMVLDALEAKMSPRSDLKVESIMTQRNLATTVVEAWHHLQYYESSGTEAPLLFAFGFPKPLRTEGTIKKPGDITRCVYNKGYLVKETTSVELSRNSAQLQFRVLEQVNIEDRAIRLIDGSFDLRQIGRDRMRIKLTTNYKPLMTPRWMWRPVEKLTAQALHNHVIDQIAVQAQMPEPLRLSQSE